MLNMSDPGAQPYDTRFPARTISKMKSIFENMATRQRLDRGVLFRGGPDKISDEALTNVIILHFASLSEDERDAIVDEFLPRFEAALRGEGIDRSAPKGEPANNGYHAQPDPVPTQARPRKSRHA
jgi:hypothetical protein